MSKTAIKPLGDRVVVKPAGDEEKTSSGIIIPDTVSKEKPEQGVVVAVGPGKWNEDGDARIPLEVKVGDTVLFSKYSPDEITHNDEKLLIIKEDALLAVVSS